MGCFEVLHVVQDDGEVLHVVQDDGEVLHFVHDVFHSKRLPIDAGIVGPCARV